MADLEQNFRMNEQETKNVDESQSCIDILYRFLGWSGCGREGLSSAAFTTIENKKSTENKLAILRINRMYPI